MADEAVEPKSSGRAKPRRERATKDGSRRRETESLSGEELVAEARRQLAAITGMEAGAVTAMERSDDDGWKLSVELLELSRIPRAADILGVYEVTLDASGKLLGYRRVRRYSRGETGGRDGV
jgi:Gas vesicle synthesis protein GvpO